MSYKRWLETTARIWRLSNYPENCADKDIGNCRRETPLFVNRHRTDESQSVRGARVRKQRIAKSRRCSRHSFGGAFVASTLDLDPGAFYIRCPAVSLPSRRATSNWKRVTFPRLHQSNTGGTIYDSFTHAARMHGPRCVPHRVRFAEPSRALHCARTVRGRCSSDVGVHYVTAAAITGAPSARMFSPDACAVDRSHAATVRRRQDPKSIGNTPSRSTDQPFDYLEFVVGDVEDVGGMARFACVCELLSPTTTADGSWYGLMR